jgi:hypothetical protein
MESSGWANYSDEAAIMLDEARAGGWTVDSGEANPPQS